MKKRPTKRKPSKVPMMSTKTKRNSRHRSSTVPQKFNVLPNSPTLYCWLVHRSFGI